MKKILTLLLAVGLLACNNTGEVRIDLDSVKSKADTLINKVENSELVDSIRSKGGKIFDTVKSRGGKIIDKAEVEINAVRMDSTK